VHCPILRSPGTNWWSYCRYYRDSCHPGWRRLGQRGRTIHSALSRSRWPPHTTRRLGNLDYHTYSVLDLIGPAPKLKVYLTPALAVTIKVSYQERYATWEDLPSLPINFPFKYHYLWVVLSDWPRYWRAAMLNY